MTHMLENLASDEANLELKVEKKKQDLERNQKRLKNLANVRPAFMDEYERLEMELGKEYQVYMEKHCNLSYLEHLLDQHHKVEQGKMEVSTLYYAHMLGAILFRRLRVPYAKCSRGWLRPRNA